MAESDAIAALELDLERCIDVVVHTAKAAGREPGRFRQLFRAMTGSEPTHGLTASGAANAADVRELLIHVRAGVLRRLAATGFSDSDAAWQLENRRLAHLVEGETRKYLDTITAPLDIAAIFGATAARFEEPAASGPGSRIEPCRSCGAPRHLEGLYDSCPFCGTAWFHTEVG